jgi:hypothetical protein
MKGPPALRASAAGGDGPEIGELIPVKTGRLIVIAAALLLPFLLSLPALSCAGKSSFALSRIQRAHEILSSAAPMREDLEALLDKLRYLGHRFRNAEDTLKEGKSLVRLAEEDVASLREDYLEAEKVLEEAAQEARGDYACYIGLLREALAQRLELLDAQEEFLRTVSDFLDVLPYAEDRSQLAFYLDSMDRIYGELAERSERAGEAAARADAFRREHGL